MNLIILRSNHRSRTEIKKGRREKERKKKAVRRKSIKTRRGGAEGNEEKYRSAFFVVYFYKINIELSYFKNGDKQKHILWSVETNRESVELRKKENFLLYFLKIYKTNIETLRVANRNKILHQLLTTWRRLIFDGTTNVRKTTRWR